MQIGVETSKAVDQRRVFVVDDDDIIRTALQFMLQDEIETHEMGAIEDAYAKTETTDWLKPDLIILGVSLIKAKGAGLIGDIRAAYPKVAILITYAKGEEEPALEGVKAGANAALAKPLTLEAVRKKVDTILGRGDGETIVQLTAFS